MDGLSDFEHDDLSSTDSLPRKTICAKKMSFKVSGNGKQIANQIFI